MMTIEEMKRLVGGDEALKANADIIKSWLDYDAEYWLNKESEEEEEIEVFILNPNRTVPLSTMIDALERRKCRYVVNLFDEFYGHYSKWASDPVLYDAFNHNFLEIRRGDNKEEIVKRTLQEAIPNIEDIVVDCISHTYFYTEGSSEYEYYYTIYCRYKAQLNEPLNILLGPPMDLDKLTSSLSKVDAFEKSLIGWKAHKYGMNEKDFLNLKSYYKEETNMENYYMVIKRNGTTEPFTPDRIREAIRKAVIASHTQDELKDFNNLVLERLTSDVVVQIKDIFDKQTDYPSSIKSIDINVIQDIVERTLIKNGFADTAKAYILYRRKRDEIRNTRDSISKTISDVLMSDSKDSDTKRENANIDGNTAMGTMLQVGANVSKNYYLNNMMSKDIAKAHTDGYIHIHDLDFYKLTVTCCQIDFKKLAKGGFNTGHGYLREPNSIGSYTTLAAIAIQSDQNDCHSFCGSIQK
jgi:hypothetical protein